jgi:hypothetical protein
VQCVTSERHVDVSRYLFYTRGAKAPNWFAQLTS